MRSTIKTFLLVPALVLAAACNKDKPVDSSLNNDLSLAGQVNPTARLDSISAAERANSLRATAPAAPAPVASATHRTSTAHRSTSSSGRRTSSSGGTVTEQRTVTQKNTKRDAAIGAAAGAVLGATTSHDKVKGGLIGAAVGGILGGVIGNNVDVKKKKVP
jgi:outer membrane lipoprotein SlyB